MRTLLLEPLKRPVRSLRRHTRTIVREILAEPLNEGQRLRLFADYLRWNTRYKYAGRTWTITFDNGLRSIVYPYPDHDAGEVNIWTRNVDLHDIRLVRAVLERGDFVVDAGCNVGNRTWAIADLLSGALLIDAGARAVERTRENLALNGLDPEAFVVLHAAVGDRQGSVTFSDLGGANTGNRVLDGDAPADVATRTVPLTTIDDELARLGRNPAFIKIDVEGYDYLALKGCERTLRSGTVKLVKFEHNRKDPLAPIEAFFAALDWRVFALDARGRVSTDRALIARNMNLFATPAARFAELVALSPR